MTSKEDKSLKEKILQEFNCGAWYRKNKIAVDDLTSLAIQKTAKEIVKKIEQLIENTYSRYSENLSIDALGTYTVKNWRQSVRDFILEEIKKEFELE